MASKNENIKLKTYNSTTITQFGRCKVKKENNNKIKICSFFVDDGNRYTLLGMPDIETLGILSINCSTTYTKDVYEAEKCRANTANRQVSISEQQYMNMKQQAYTPEKYYTNTDTKSKFENKDKPMVTDNDKIYYFLPGPNWDNDKTAGTEIIQQLWREFKDVFNGIGCFHETFSLQVKPDNKLYQVPQRCIVYALQKPFKEELEWFQQHDTTAPVGMDDTVDGATALYWCQKPYGKVRSCLDLARLNQATKRQVYSRPTLNDIFLKLKNAQYLSVIDVILGYHNIKLDERSSYLTTFACQFGRFR